MRAYLIDPHARTIRTIRVPPDLRLRYIKDTMQCDEVAGLWFSSGPAPRQWHDHVMYHGPQDDSDDPRRFRLGSHSPAYRGRAVVLGLIHADNGTEAEASPSLTLADMCGLVAWCEPSRRDRDQWALEAAQSDEKSPPAQVLTPNQSAPSGAGEPA